MLSRTADHLFWMSRYTERAENTARMLDVAYQTRCCRSRMPRARAGWHSLLSISELIGILPAPRRRRAARNVLFHGARREQPSSIVSRLEGRRARTRAPCGDADHRGLGDAEPDLAGATACSKAGAFERPGQFFEWVKPLAPVARRRLWAPC